MIHPVQEKEDLVNKIREDLNLALGKAQNLRVDLQKEKDRYENLGFQKDRLRLTLNEMTLYHPSDRSTF